jgi:hypothetical protein
MRHPRGGGAGMWQFLPIDPAALQAMSEMSGRFNYATAVGEMLDSSVVSTAVCWKMATFVEASAVVQKFEDGWWDTWRKPDGALGRLVQLLRKPNQFYGPRSLWMATCLDYTFGEAYWLKIRNVIGQIIELWWVPRGLMTPIGPADGSEFISHYEYRTGGEPQRIDRRDVVHFRFGHDPQNPRRGFSPLAALVREVYTDEECCTFTASIVRNLGVIGVIISPDPEVVKAGASPTMLQEDVQEVRDYIDANLTRDRRGKTLAIGSPTKAQLLQYNLQGFELGPLRDISEERVSAAIRVPAAVIGFGTGLQQTKVGATMKELVALAWEACLIPDQKKMAEDATLAFEDDFGLEPLDGSRIGFDLSEVTAIWEDELKARGDRVTKLFNGGVIKRGEARRELNLKTDPADDIYVLPSSVTTLLDGEEADMSNEEDDTTPPADGDQEEDTGTKRARRPLRKQSEPRVVVPDILVTVPTPQVNVTVPVPEVHNHVPPAPPPTIEFNPTVTVPPSPTPVIEPRIDVQVKPPRAVRIERDREGRIIRIVREF